MSSRLEQQVAQWTLANSNWSEILDEDQHHRNATDTIARVRRAAMQTVGCARHERRAAPEQEAGWPVPEETLYRAADTNGRWVSTVVTLPEARRVANGWVRENGWAVRYRTEYVDAVDDALFVYGVVVDFDPDLGGFRPYLRRRVRSRLNDLGRKDQRRRHKLSRVLGRWPSTTRMGRSREEATPDGVSPPEWVADRIAQYRGDPVRGSDDELRRIEDRDVVASVRGVIGDGNTAWLADYHGTGGTASHTAADRKRAQRLRQQVRDAIDGD